MPKRIVSFNLCTDQYLLAFADRARIAALSRYARDKELSFYAQRARTFPVSGSTVEEVVILKPDLVIAGTYSSPAKRAQLKRLGFKVLEFPHPRTLDEMTKQMLDAAAAVGRPNKGRLHVQQLRRALRALREAGRKLGRKTVLYMQRRGFVTGEDTLIDELITHAGLFNAARRFHVRGYGRVALERIVVSRPEILIFGRVFGAARDHGSALLRHRALSKTVATSARIVLPVRETVCPGPSITAAVRTLTRALERIARKKGP